MDRVLIQSFLTSTRTVIPLVEISHTEKRSEILLSILTHNSKPRDAWHAVEHLRTSGADVLSIDWRVPLDVARQTLGPEIAVQGNLDPASLFAPWPVLQERSDAVLRRAGDAPGHIFNLGHGILPETPVDNVRRLVEHVHTWRG